jgi:uncharacterized membrane protein (UPF0127 family)
MTKNNRHKNQKPQEIQKQRKLHWYDVTFIFMVAAGIIYFLFSQNLFNKNITDTDYVFKKEGTLTFTDSLGNIKTRIDIQIADNEYDRELGLMFRKHMQENRGMLFIFPQEGIQSFWMHNTYIPLDMIFVNAQDKIVTIQNADKTLSDQTYSSIKPAQFVIEVNLGFAKKYGLKVGDKISWVKAKTDMGKNSN